MNYLLWSSKFKNNHSGFTLVEVLIALFIFSILGMITIISISSVVHTYQRMKRVNNQLEQIQTAATLMRSDFTQMIQRPILSEHGEELPSLVTTSAHYVEFTTAGYSNPLAFEKRSTLRRVAYEWRDNKLIRLSWSALDRPPQITPERRILLRNVTQMTWMYVNHQGQLMNVWVTDNSGNPLILLPQAILVTLTLSHLGVWQGVFPLVSRGYGE